MLALAGTGNSRRIRNSLIDSWICTLSLEEDKIAVHSLSASMKGFLPITRTIWDPILPQRLAHIPLQVQVQRLTISFRRRSTHPLQRVLTKRKKKKGNLCPAPFLKQETHSYFKKIKAC